MTFCPKCGHECRAGERFCEECGATLATTPPSRGRRRWLFLGAISLLVVIAGIVALVVLGGLRRVDLAKAAPPDTEVWFEIDARPTPSRIAKVRPILKALEDSGLRERLAQLAEETSEEAAVEVKWEEDLKPWIGFQYAVALSGLAEGLSSGGHENLRFLGMATVRDKKVAEALLERITEDWASKRDAEVRRESRNGLAIHVVEPSSDVRARVCYAFSGRILYVSGSPDELTEAVERMRGRGECVKDQEWYRQVRKATPGDAIGWAAWSSRLIADGFRHHPGEDALELAGAGAASFDVTGNGVDFGVFQLGSETYRRRFADLTRGFGGHNAWKSSFGCVPKDALGAVALTGVSDLAELWGSWVADTRLRDDWRNTERKMDRELGLNTQTATRDIADVCLALLSIGNPVWNTDVIAEVRGNGTEEIRDLVNRTESALRRGVGVWSPRSEQIEGLPCKHVDLFFGLGLWYGIKDASLILASSQDAMTKAVRAYSNPSERISAFEGWNQAQQPGKKGSLLACIVSPPRLAQDLGETLSESDLANGGRGVLEIAGAVPWVALSATLDGDGGTALLNAELDYSDLCTGASRVLDATVGMLDAADRSNDKVVCLSNMKNLSIAVQMFTSDHDGHFPHLYSWVDELDAYVNNRRVFKCPADDLQERSCSYAMNAQLRGLRMSDLTDPANTVVFFDTVRPGPNPFGGPDDVASPPRHPGGNNYAFADGSVRCLAGVPNFQPRSSRQVAWPAQRDRYLTEGDLEGLSAWELDVLRNEIYARHGRPFSRSDLREHFSRQSWYRPRQNWDSAGLNPIERRNAAFVLDYQRRTGRSMR